MPDEQIIGLEIDPDDEIDDLEVGELVEQPTVETEAVANDKIESEESGN